MWINVGQIPGKCSGPGSPEEKNCGEAKIQSTGLPEAVESEQGEFLSSVTGLFPLGLSVGNLGSL